MRFTKAQKKALRERWVKALRSGAYGQTQRQLGRVATTGESYCCLGVLCEVFRAEHPGVLRRLTSGDAVIYGNKSKGEAKSMHAPPDVVVRAAGLRDRMGRFRHPDGYESALSAINDRPGTTFGQIADLIESNPPGLFE